MSYTLSYTGAVQVSASLGAPAPTLGGHGCGGRQQRPGERVLRHLRLPSLLMRVSVMHMCILHLVFLLYVIDYRFSFIFFKATVT